MGVKGRRPVGAFHSLHGELTFPASISNLLLAFGLLMAPCSLGPETGAGGVPDRCHRSASRGTRFCLGLGMISEVSINGLSGWSLKEKMRKR